MVAVPDTFEVSLHCNNLNIILAYFKLFFSPKIHCAFIFFRFSSSKSGRVYLHTDVRMIIFRKSDMDTATVHNNNNIDSGFELRSYTNGPGNPKFSPR